MFDPTIAHGRISTTRMPGQIVLSVMGELDIATTAGLRIEIAEILSATTAPVIIDLSGVSFCDASGLALLVGAQRRARIDGRTLVLAGPRPSMTKLLHITGLDQTFSVHPTLVAARLRARRHSTVA